MIKLSPLFKDNPLLSVTPPHFFHSFPRDVPFHNAAAAPSQIRLRAECIVDSKNVIYIYKLTGCKYKICLPRLYGCPLSFYTLTPSQRLASMANGPPKLSSGEMKKQIDGSRQQSDYSLTQRNASLCVEAMLTHDDKVHCVLSISPSGPERI